MKNVRIIFGLMILLFPATVWATMDGSLASISRDDARLSTEMGSTSPCPLPAGEFEAIKKGQYDPKWLQGLCLYEELDSFIHHQKVREYIRLIPPESVFAVYWEGRLDPKVVLGPALAGFKNGHGRKEWKSGRFLYIRSRTGILAVDMKLLPPGMDPKTLAP